MNTQILEQARKLGIDEQMFLSYSYLKLKFNMREIKPWNFQ
ncbi:MAG: hypothetical protein WCI11_09110 [Candidatus Methylumidiphilus sp.]